MELVSIIIPTYGGGEFLKRAVDSVLRQTYENIEVIVVDDNGLGTASQLLTKSIMEVYMNDSRVKYVCHEVNINGSAARNTGFRASSGEFITLLDDDDEYTIDKVERQVKDLQSLDSEYGLTYCSKEFYKNGIKFKESHVHYSGNLFYEVMIHKAVVSSSCLMVRRSVWESVGGFDESFRRHQDYEFSARVAYKYKIHACDFIGHKHHIEGRNAPKNPEQAIAYRTHYLDKMKQYYITLPRKQQKDIEIYNQLEPIFLYLRRHEYWEFVKHYFRIHPGIRGIKSIIKRIK